MCLAAAAAGCAAGEPFQAGKPGAPALKAGPAAPAPEVLQAKAPGKGAEETAPAKRTLPAAREAEKPAGAPSSTSSPRDITLPLPLPEEGEGRLEKSASPSRLGEPPRGFEFDIPIVRNEAVDRWIDFFTGPGRTWFAEWIRRGGKYIGLFRRILKEENLPQDLAYLALIESGFSLRARSRSGAVGPWQFMPATARRLGLKVNHYLDERRNPMKATRTAAAYLTLLYREFGDWHLALAGYNAGERRIRSAIRRTGRKSFWAIARTRLISRETRNYVAKFLAGLIIAKHPEVFGFAGLDLAPPLRYETVSLPRGMSIRTIARLAEVPLEELSELNAELRWSVTPPKPGYQFLLPPGKRKGFLARLAKAPKELYLVSGRYRIRPGDTFGSIAARLRIRLPSLLELNAHLDPRHLRIGTQILLSAPGPAKRRAAAAAPAGAGRAGSGEAAAKARRPVHHVVGPGENIWTISRRYGISMQDILRMNRLTKSAVIFPGDRIRVRR